MRGGMGGRRREGVDSPYEPAARDMAEDEVRGEPGVVVGGFTDPQRSRVVGRVLVGNSRRRRVVAGQVGTGSTRS